MKKNKMKDKVYKKEILKVEDFVFDEKVAKVFPDMLNRSVPAYETLLKMIGIIAGKVIQKNSNCYDLGCSLGASSFSIMPKVAKKNARIIAVDSSSVMIKGFQENLKLMENKAKIDLYCKDINKMEMASASLVILNLTLQFVALSKRDKLIKKIYKALLPKGALVLTEKIVFNSKAKQKLFTSYYEEFKKVNGYSDLEISQKRTALEKVLLPETIKAHKKRLKKAGFTQVDIWFQSLTFVSFICIK